RLAINLSRLQLHFESLEKSQERSERSLRGDIAKNREEASWNARQTREEIGHTLKAFGDSLQTHMAEIAGLQRDQLDNFATKLSMLNQTNEQKLDKMRETVEERLQAIQAENAQQLSLVRDDSSTNSKTLREEVGNSLKSFNDSLVKN